MARRTTITLMVLLLLGLLVIAAILSVYTKWPIIEPPLPKENKEKIRFVNYLVCSMALCSGEAKETFKCDKDICASPEVQAVGVIDEDENHRKITCAEVCEKISGDGCYERLCGKEFSIEYTFKDTINLTQDDIKRIGKPFSKVMHWCCKYFVVGLVAGKGPLARSAGKFSVPKSFAKENCSSETEKPYWCIFENGTKVSIYGYEDFTARSLWPFGKKEWEFCTPVGNIPHSCSNANITLSS